MLYQIINNRSGLDLGVYSGESPQQAIQAMLDASGGTPAAVVNHFSRSRIRSSLRQSNVYAVFQGKSRISTLLAIRVQAADAAPLAPPPLIGHPEQLPFE